MPVYNPQRVGSFPPRTDNQREFQMSSSTQTAATLDDLHRAEGKAELIAGRIVRLMPTGFRPGQVGGRIYRSLDDHAARTGRGVSLPDNVGFVVPELASGRQSFAPDASYFLGPLPPDEMDFIEGPPTLAVEVRSKGDYGDSAEAEMAAKRADYFEAGTAVVWDVDPRAKLVRVYRAAMPAVPTVFGPGQVADAEPAVPGWRLAIDPVFA
jgi:Uma2 family endonuclease